MGPARNRASGQVFEPLEVALNILEEDLKNSKKVWDPRVYWMMKWAIKINWMMK